MSERGSEYLYPRSVEEGGSAKKPYPIGPIALAVLIVAVGYFTGQAPRPVPATAPVDQFSAERALKHVPGFALEPHPAGTAALDHARDYIMAELTRCGVEAQVQTTTVIEDRRISCVENVLGRIPGTNNGGSFVLTAHYDSTYSGPGAADDGSGVIAMLETARALRAGPRLRNDVVLVFTGDEERGRKGIKAFARHPWARNVGVTMGLEARGTHGPSYMFETSAGNSWLIEQLRRAGVPVRANSFMYEVHRRTPNTTDFERIKDKGFPGYNVAFVGGFCYYHSANDNLHNLSPASIQHHGAYTLGLARYFGNLPAAEARKAGRADSDSVFFNVVGPWLVAYPACYSRPIAGLAGIVFAAALAAGLVRRRLKPLDMVVGALALLGTVAACSIVTGGLLWLAYRVHGVYIVYREALYVSAFGSAALAVSAAVWLALPRRFELRSLHAGALVWLAAGVGFLERWAPLGSFFAAWPLLGISLGLAASCLLSRRENDSAAWLVGLTICAAPGLLFIGPGIQSLVYMGSVFVVPVALAAVIVYGATILPQFVSACSRIGWRLSAITGAGALVCLAVALGTNHSSPSQPRANGVCYALDLDRHTAFWASGDRTVDAWTSQFFTSNDRGTLEEFFPGRRTVYFKARAPVVDLQGPQVDTVEDAVVAGVRTARLRITSPRKVPEVELALSGPKQILSVAVDGRELPGARRDWTLHFDTFPRSGSVEVTIKATPGDPLRLRIQETSYSLAGAPAFRPRPNDMIRRPNTLDWFEGNKLTGDIMLVARTFDIGPINGNLSPH